MFTQGGNSDGPTAMGRRRRSLFAGKKQPTSERRRQKVLAVVYSFFFFFTCCCRPHYLFVAPAEFFCSEVFRVVCRRRCMHGVTPSPLQPLAKRTLASSLQQMHCTRQFMLGTAGKSNLSWCCLLHYSCLLVLCLARLKQFRHVYKLAKLSLGFKIVLGKLI